MFSWRGTFDKHFEDGADDPSTPPYGGGETGGPTAPAPPPVSVGEQPPATGSRAQVAVAWARNQLGSDAYAGRCERFVESAYGAPPGTGYQSALQAASKLRLHEGPIGDAPAGALLYFGPKKNCPAGPRKYGHAGLSLGNGRMISALGTVKITDLNLKRNRVWQDAYLGWAKAPRRWPGR